MSLSIEQLTAEALSLTREQRAILAGRIVSSIDPSPFADQSTLLTVAERRRDEIVNGKVKTVPAETVAQRVRRHLG